MPSKSFFRIRLVIVVLMLASAGITGCGYRLAGARTDNGRGRTIAVPTFSNRTTTYRVEQRMSEALRNELIRRTRYEVVSETSGDVAVTGEVLGYAAIPVLFNEQGRASSYTISVDLRIVITETQSGRVLYQNDRLTFRELFELANSSAEFVPEEPAAVDRLARRFASSVVASLLNPAS